MDTKLTPARDHVVRLQELVQSYRRLLSKGIVMFSDEVASARRRLQFNTGPSGISETLKNLSKCEEMCWRHPPSDRRQAEMTLNQLREGLLKANRVFLELRLDARSRLNHAQYWTLMERIGERSKQVRSEELIRLQKKEI